ncbi:E3 ubiquitin-protein ligase TRAIP-like [Planococcus citri]|uniref:E3 ubiquitin-protein ligase TRAIP-like n=1 Tax=Planococcus citri TaxID=170843 RepID=UPI0031F72E13
MNALCSICLDLFHKSSQESAYSSKCGHVFHHKCILDWHEKSKTCPDCRVSFTKEEIYKLNFHCDDASEASFIGMDSKVKELQVELTKKIDELAEAQIELAKKNSEIVELEETCKTVIENVETLSAENERIKKELQSAKKMMESSKIRVFESKENLEPSSEAIEPNETVGSISIT